MADRNYWVRTEQGRTWGPYTLEALDRLRGQLTEKCEASLDGQNWRPGTDFPELKELLAPPRKVEKKSAPPPAQALRLVVRNKVSLVFPMPEAYREKIQAFLAEHLPADWNE